MIYIETGSTDVTYNFALEYYFTTVSPLSEPLFLFWQTTPTCMVGRYQNTFEELDLDYIKDHDITIVRRLSGGGTIFTDLGAYQYTFIQKDEEGAIEFQKFITPVVDALSSLGIQADFSGRNDLHIQGKKVSGTAQYKLAGQTVHHGSLLFDTDIDTMVKATSVDPEKISSKGIKSVRERVTNIREHLPVDMSRSEFKEVMVRHILGNGSRREITAEEDAAIKKIARDIFASWDHNFGLNPNFSLKKSRRLPGGRLTIHLDVKKGRIEAAKFLGDFFATEELRQLEEALSGIVFKKEDLSMILLQDRWSRVIRGIQPEDMLDLVLS